MTGSTFDPDATPHAFGFTFDTNVSASLGTGDFAADNLSAGAILDPANFSWTYGTGNALLLDTGQQHPSAVNYIPDGNYEVFLRGDGIEDANGVTLGSDHAAGAERPRRARVERGLNDGLVGIVDQAVAVEVADGGQYAGNNNDDDLLELIVGGTGLRRNSNQQVRLTWNAGSGNIRIYKSAHGQTKLAGLEVESGDAVLAGPIWVEGIRLSDELEDITLTAVALDDDGQPIADEGATAELKLAVGPVLKVIEAEITNISTIRPNTEDWTKPIVTSGRLKPDGTPIPAVKVKAEFEDHPRAPSVRFIQSVQILNLNAGETMTVFDGGVGDNRYTYVNPQLADDWGDIVLDSGFPPLAPYYDGTTVGPMREPKNVGRYRFELWDSPKLDSEFLTVGRPPNVKTADTNIEIRFSAHIVLGDPISYVSIANLDWRWKFHMTTDFEEQVFEPHTVPPVIETGRSLHPQSPSQMSVNQWLPAADAITVEVQ